MLRAAQHDINSDPLNETQSQKSADKGELGFKSTAGRCSSTNCAPWMIRHVATCPDLIHRRFEVFVDLRIFVFELDLAAAELHARERASFAVLRAHELVAPVVPAKRQVARRRRAGIEMLMEPLIRRHHHAARPPIDALRRFTRGPENRIALTGENNDMRAGAVLMPFL